MTFFIEHETKTHVSQTKINEKKFAKVSTCNNKYSFRIIHQTTTNNNKQQQTHNKHTPQHHNTTTPQHHNTTTPQHHNTTTPQHDNTTTRQHDNTTAQLHNCTTAQLHNCKFSTRAFPFLCSDFLVKISCWRLMELHTPRVSRSGGESDASVHTCGMHG